MLTRIALILAILAGLAAAGLNFTQVKEKITALKLDRDNEKKEKEDAQKNLRNTKTELDKTSKELAQTKTTLQATTEERDKLQQENGTLGKKVEGLTSDLAKTRAERDDAKSSLAAFEATGQTPAQIVAFTKTLTGVQNALTNSETENKILNGQIRKLKNELAKYQSPDKPVLLPPTAIGKVLVSDPKWNFVVLDLGENKGVMQRGELLVNRNGKLVAKVVVSSVQKDRCVANIVPGWKIGEVMEGDQVVPAHPES